MMTKKVRVWHLKGGGPKCEGEGKGGRGNLAICSGRGKLLVLIYRSLGEIGKTDVDFPKEDSDSRGRDETCISPEGGKSPLELLSREWRGRKHEKAYYNLVRCDRGKVGLHVVSDVQGERSSLSR